ncbi:MAG TPA: methyltransferase domain-containing protein [Spirochaetia bacterium]|nr:methyltransferase domain-containing protein [Spirochaetia bacterium]HRZ65808.1 methyltransferase domain-containing protein [Spirochaetia bacterium]
MGAKYIMESVDEAKRLELKTDASVVESFARRAGLGPGMRVVDIACGTGVTTSILGAMTGKTGYALGVDASEERIARARERYGDEGTGFELRDFLAPMEGLGSFDFAWIRFALEYYKAEGFDIARNAAALLEEGGILCLVDLDYNCLSHYGMPPRLEAALASAVSQVEAKGNFDPYAGRKLYSHLYRLGFEDIKVEAGAHHLIYGELSPVDEYNWAKKIEVLSRNLDIGLPGYSGCEEFLEDFMKFFRDPGRFTYTPVIAAWGRKGRG